MDGDCIEFEDLRDFYKKDVDVETFDIYLTEIYSELSSNINTTEKGISRTRFKKYLGEVNIFLVEKIFSAFDTRKCGFLNFEDFGKPIKILKYGTFEQVAKIIFDIYDFNSDSFVTVGDIKQIIAYLPLKSEEDKRGYQYQLQSLNDLDEIIKITFGDLKKQISFELFLKLLEKNANVFLLLVCYLYLTIPIFEKAMAMYKVQKKKKYSFDSINKFKIDGHEDVCIMETKLPINPIQEKDRKLKLSPVKLNITKSAFSPVTDLWKRKLQNKTQASNSLKRYAKKQSTVKESNKLSIDDEETKKIIPVSPPKKTISSEGKYLRELCMNNNKFNNNAIIINKNGGEKVNDEEAEKTLSVRIIENSEEIITNDNNKPYESVIKEAIDQSDQYADLIYQVKDYHSPEHKTKLEETHINSIKKNTLDETHHHNLFLKNSPKLQPNSVSSSPSKDSKGSPIKLSPYKNTKKSCFGEICERINEEKETVKTDSLNSEKSPKINYTKSKNLLLAKENLTEINKIESNSVNVKKFFFEEPESNYSIATHEENKLSSLIINDQVSTTFETFYDTGGYDEYLNTEEELKKSIIYEGELSKVKKTLNNIDITGVYLVLIDKNIYYYKDEESSKKENYNYLSTNFLTGSFIRLNPPEKVDDNCPLNSFTIFFQDNKKKKFYHKDLDTIKLWVKYLRGAINYRNLFDYYEIQSTLGEGQYGKVTNGLDKSTKKNVAIKIISKKKAKENNEVYELVRSEIDILKISKHPSIINYLDNFENSDYIFIVMDYIKCGTLQEYLKSKHFNISEKAGARIAFQLVEALKYLNTFGIIHRDFKPENIMVVDNLVDETEIEVKITDFGFGKIIGSCEKTKEGYGTLAFVAPEVLTRAGHNSKVDIWSFGVVLFYMFCGEIHFKGRNKEETSSLICKKDLIFPVKFKNLSHDLLDLIYMCLIKNHEKRICIDKVLNHDWFRSFNLNPNTTYYK